jgi:DNA-binding MarR family transcriptional regulator|nr:helix-turn-helix transcriptional regulator [uncultured Clostridium sp.]
MVVFNKRAVINWEEKYKQLEIRSDELYEENRKLKKQIKLLEERIKKTGYLEPKERQISNEQILYIKTLRVKEGLSYKAISEETGWSKATISRVINGAYDK